MQKPFQRRTKYILRAAERALDGDIFFMLSLDVRFANYAREGLSHVTFSNKTEFYRIACLYLCFAAAMNDNGDFPKC
ncbi:hypothetical protein A2198_02580 [Candidatus Peribacteria bacterium RIFOXYA1_FULL_56_14]|nr:MAG: hypothetical protein A2198_02580 [Candidatus Peribacteria bacterium RIFOXYA1_FULL_56_14]